MPTQWRVLGESSHAEVDLRADQRCRSTDQGATLGRSKRADVGGPNVGVVFRCTWHNNMLQENAGGFSAVFSSILRPVAVLGVAILPQCLPSRGAPLAPHLAARTSDFLPGQCQKELHASIAGILHGFKNCTSPLLKPEPRSFPPLGTLWPPYLDPWNALATPSSPWSLSPGKGLRTRREGRWKSVRWKKGGV